MTTSHDDLLFGVDMEGGENFCDDIYNFLKNQGKDLNLLMNSGFGVWSQSDDNKGLGTLDYDDLAIATFVVGEAITTAAPAAGSGATGKVITNDGATLVLGACTGRFNDDELITGADSGATADVNMPDTDPGVDLVRNGEFEAGVGGWTPNDCLLAFVAGGYVGNCLRITQTVATQDVEQTIAGFIIGKIYKISFYVTDGSDAGIVGDYGVSETSLGAFVSEGSFTTTAVWVNHTLTFEATATTLYFRFSYTLGGGKTTLVDEVTLYEITPCCTEADTLAFDGWVKTASLDIYRQHNDGGTLTKDGSFYSLKAVPTVAGAYFYFPKGILDKTEWYQQFAGRTITIGVWAKTLIAGHFRLRIYDGAITYSSYHTGGDIWEWIEVTRAINATPTQVHFQFDFTQSPAVNGDTIVYISQPMLVFGSSIGEGNYQAKPQEWIYGEKAIPSNKYDNTDDWSDLVAYAVLNLEADSDAMIPKGAKAIMLHVEAVDSGSGAAVDLHIHLRTNSTTTRFYTLCWAGKTNNAEAHLGGMQPCNNDGDIEVEIQASGDSTLDIKRFRFLGVQVN